MKKLSTITIDSDTFAEEISAIYSAQDKEKIITLTYQKAIDRIFDILSKHKLKITFFLITSHLQYKDVSKTCRNILSAGNEIADHTYSHNRNFIGLRKEELEKEINFSRGIMLEKLGIEPIGFRSPGAEINLETINVLSDKKYFYDSSSNASLLYEKMKKVYLKIKRQRYIHHKLNNSDIPIRIKYFYELPITISTFLNIPLFNFFMAPLKNIGIKIIKNTIKNKKYINYTIHLHELISLKEIKEIKIKKGLMNLMDLNISEKLSFIDKALYILKDNSDVLTMKDIYYNLLCGEKNDKY